MTTQILNFKKTDHFLFSQWDRKIDNKILYKVLPFVNCTQCKKDVIIAEESFLNKKGIEANSNENLIIIIKQKILVTCFWCKNPSYLFKKEKNANFQKLN